MISIRKYYYHFIDIDEAQEHIFPFASISFKEFVETFYGEGTLTKISFALNDTNVEKLWQDLVANYYEYPLFIIKKPFTDTLAPNAEEVENAICKWIINLLINIENTYPYYNTLLTEYTSALTHLMDDIKATSKNKVKFNDTPQNPNTEGIYEGDNYITHFTSTEGENSSPLTTKMIRLKEIQDNFKSVMRDWVKNVGRVFLPREDEEL